MAEFDRPVKSPEYWAKRAEWIEQSVFKDVDQVNKKLIEGYNTVLKDIEKDIAEFISINQDLVSMSKPVSIKEYLQTMDWQFEQLNYWVKNGGSPETINRAKTIIDRFNTSHRLTRLEVLERQLQGRIGEFGLQTNDTMTEALKEVYESAYDRKQFTIARGVGYGYQYSKPNFKAIEKTILYPWAEDGSMFSNRIWEYVNNESTNFIKAVRKTIASGAVAQGKNPSTLAKEIVGFGKQSLSASQLKFNATRLLYTEASHILAEAEADVSNEWGLTEYVFLATLDDNTSKICQSLDGQTFNYKDRKVGTNYPPMHPLCRSTTYDVVPNSLYTKRASRGKDGKTVHEIPANVTYSQWQEFQKTGNKPWEKVQSVTTIKDKLGTNFNEMIDYFSKTWGVDVDSTVTQLDFEAVKAGSQGIVDVLEKFPQLKGELKRISTSTNGIMAASYGGQITFNPSYFASLERADKASGGWYHPKNSNARGSGQHEMGHIIEAFLIKKGINNGTIPSHMGVTYWSKCTLATEVVSEASKVVKKQRKGVTVGELVGEISGYAKTDRSEAMAEAICDFMTNGEDSTDISKEIMKVVERRINE